MKKTGLYVVFHASANVDRTAQDELRDATFNLFPAAAYSAKTGTDLSFLSSGRRCFNGDCPDLALEYMKERAESQRLAIVTLCPLMMKAAAKIDVAVVTIGQPPVYEGRQFIGNNVAHLPNLMQHAKLSR